MSKSAADATYRYADTYEWMAHITRQNPLIITCAVNGGFQGQESHPALPETPDEIAEAAHEAYSAGAVVVHIHGRDPNRLWDCTGSAEVYREINARVRERCPEIIINNTTGGGFSTTDEDRLRQLDALPEMASFNLGPEMVRYEVPARPAPLPHAHDGFVSDECSAPTYGFLEQLAGEMKQRHIKPELELYEPGQYWVAADLIERGLIDAPYYFQYVMGYQTSVYPTPWNIVSLVRELPEGSLFSVIGLSKFQWALTTFSIILGGNVRVGLEDNLYLARGRKLTGNGEAVGRIVRIAEELNRPVASPAEARELLGLPATPSAY
jgi:3-keto-5-aminohexanoate cleavage enzyme